MNQFLAREQYQILPFSSRSILSANRNEFSKVMFMRSVYFSLFFITLSSAANAQVLVQGYVRSDGIYVPPHHRTAPDAIITNNYNYPGNYNPNVVVVQPHRPLQAPIDYSVHMPDMMESYYRGRQMAREDAIQEEELRRAMRR